tara:strand:- start:5762 stop:6097 length:336 start_codon:yes stop_codon:yes gene_type:complete
MTIKEAWGCEFGDCNKEPENPAENEYNTIHEARTPAPTNLNENENYQLDNTILLNRILELENQLKDRSLTTQTGGFAGINFDSLNLNNINTVILLGYFLIFIIDLVMNKKN